MVVAQGVCVMTRKPAEERQAERLVLVAVVFFVLAGGVARAIWPAGELPDTAPNVVLRLPATAATAYFPVSPTWVAGPTIVEPARVWTTRTDPITGDMLTLTLFLSPSFTATVAASPCANRWTPPPLPEDRYYGIWPCASCTATEPATTVTGQPIIRTAFVYWVPGDQVAVGIYFRGRNPDVPTYLRNANALSLP